MSKISSQVQILDSSCGFVRVEDRVVARVKGQDRIRFLHNITTNDIKSLPSTGGGCIATMVTKIGKIITDLKVKIFEDSILIDFPLANKNKTLETVKKYIVMDRVELVETPFFIYQIHGIGASEVIKKNLGIEPAAKNYYFSGIDPIVTRFKFTSYDGFEIFSSCRQDFKLPELDYDTLEMLRIEAGFPEWGHEIREDLLPMECGLETAISYNKGCYIGQEIIQRVKTYSEPPKRLVGLVPEKEISAGLKILMNETEIGQVTSSAFSITLNKPIALAILQKKYTLGGTEVTIEGGILAKVTSLPFI